MRNLSGFQRAILLPENRSALAALQDLAIQVISQSPPQPNVLVLHGPSGAGKTCLVSAFADAVRAEAPATALTVLSANDFPLPWERDDGRSGQESYDEAGQSDVLIVEDLQ